MRRTQKGQELSEQLKKVFMKHRHRATTAHKVKEEKDRNRVSKEIPGNSPANAQQKAIENTPANNERQKGKAKRSGS